MALSRMVDIVEEGEEGMRMQVRVDGILIVGLSLTPGDVIGHSYTRSDWPVIGTESQEVTKVTESKSKVKNEKCFDTPATKTRIQE